MNRVNYQKELERVLATLTACEKKPALLLHSCCAPCSSYCLEYLSPYFDITVYYYNPNITDEAEYRLRAFEQKRLTEAFSGVAFTTGPYEPEAFFAAAKGWEREPEGGERCFRCYKLRLQKAVQAAYEGGYDYVTTTLSISPLKNAQKLNEIGMAAVSGPGVRWLPGDFKKREGYRRSVELSAQYGLYRQDYCGCVYSREEARKRREAGGRTQETGKQNRDEGAQKADGQDLGGGAIKR